MKSRIKTRRHDAGGLGFFLALALLAYKKDSERANLHNIYIYI